MNEPLKEGQNPREHLRRHRERGPERFEFTYEDVAKAAGLAVGTVRNNSHVRYMVRSLDLQGLAGYILGKVLRRPTLLMEGEVRDFLGEKHLLNWKARWPRIDLAYCGITGCWEVVVEGGFCGKHGYPQMRLDPAKHYLQVRVGGDFVPYHQLLMRAAPGNHVHHKDGNKWNNRPDNLQEVTPEEHRELHRLLREGDPNSP